jgi:hypothetical protein
MYKVTLTPRGWQIFENGESWGVCYPSMDEAFADLKQITIALEAATITADYSV